MNGHDRAHGEPVKRGLLIGVIALVLLTVTVASVVTTQQSGSREWDFLLIDLPFGAVFIALGCLILFRAGWNRVGWILVALGGLFPTFRSVAVLLPRDHASWLVDVWMVTNLFVLMAFLSLVFPSGRLPHGPGRWSRLARWATLALVIAVAAPVTGPPGTSLAPDVVPESGFVVAVVVLAGAVVSLVVRLRHSVGEERAQLAWLMTALAILVVLTLATNVAAGVWGASENVYAVVAIGILAVPVAITVAVLRYRLYEIDRLISRTVSYALVAGALAAVYAAVAIGMPQLIGVTRREPVLVAGATLAAAALFNPLRRRVQGMVDRRFNRARYDAQQEADRFAERLRTEMELDEISSELIGVVSKTMHPASATVWVREEHL